MVWIWVLSSMRNLVRQQGKIEISNQSTNKWHEMQIAGSIINSARSMREKELLMKRVFWAMNRIEQGVLNLVQYKRKESNTIKTRTNYRYITHTHKYNIHTHI